jgi:hypothetical protein
MNILKKISLYYFFYYVLYFFNTGMRCTVLESEVGFDFIILVIQYMKLHHNESCQNIFKTYSLLRNYAK